MPSCTDPRNKRHGGPIRDTRQETITTNHYFRPQKKQTAECWWRMGSNVKMWSQRPKHLMKHERFWDWKQALGPWHTVPNDAQYVALILCRMNGEPKPRNSSVSTSQLSKQRYVWLVDCLSNTFTSFETQCISIQVCQLCKMQFTLEDVCPGTVTHCNTLLLRYTWRCWTSLVSFSSMCRQKS